ncbi:MAG TPA: DNA polymerase [Burkholderiales bacterium]|nr:DNA polymerase [Burkholderiales bacterium]
MVNRITDRDSQVECLTFLSFLSEVCLDLETTGLIPFKDEIVLVIVGNSKKTYVIEYEGNKEFLEELFGIIKNKRILGHNLKFDIKFVLYHFKILLRNLKDTMIQSRIIFNGLVRRHSLEECVKEMFLDYLSKIYDFEKYCWEITDYKKVKTPTELAKVNEKFTILAQENKGLTVEAVAIKTVEEIFDKSVRMEFTKKDLVLEDRHFEYGAQDVAFIELLVNYHEKFIKSYSLEKLQTIEMEFISVLAVAELYGIRFNKQKWIQNNIKNRAELVEFDLKVRQHMELMLAVRGQDTKITETLNFASPTQLLKLFKIFDSRIESTGSDYLLQFIKTTEVSRDLLQLIHYLIGTNAYDKHSYRSIAKLCSTYGEKFLAYCEGDYIRTEFKQATTSTGRLASGDLKEDYTNNKGGTSQRKANVYVPLQNLPKEENLRSCFIAEDGKTLITIDMQAAEVRIAASHSQCDFFLEGLNKGLDFHSSLAETTFRIVTNNPSLVVTDTFNSEYRTIQKTITFGLFYGAGAGKISEVLNVQMDTAKKVYNGLRNLIPKLFAFLDKVSNSAVKNGYLVANSVTNRRRWFGEYIKYRKDMTNFGVPYSNVHSVKREASNFPIQGTNADMMKESAVNIDKYLRGKYGDDFSNRQLFWVHDEFIVQVPIEEAKEDKKNIEEIIIKTCNTYLNGIEMKVKGEINTHWSK